MQQNIIFSIVVLLFLTGCTSPSQNQVTPQQSDTNTESRIQQTQNQQTQNVAEQVIWQFNGTQWESSGSAPQCPDPFQLSSFTDFSQATSILYPGQIRGEYKPHGGLRFDNNKTNEVTVKVPFDAVLYRGSRYLEAGETQYLLDFIHPCGFLVRFDHLHTLSNELQTIISTLPAPQADDSRTHTLPAHQFKRDTTIATKVGFIKNNNVSFDIGLYDLRKPNKISQTNTAWASRHQNQKETAYYGVCWCDYLLMPDHQRTHVLPAADHKAGKQSDYCSETH